MKPHEIWREQCDAAKIIARNQGAQRALAYLVGEKMFTYVAISRSEPNFAAELPKFGEAVREMFSADDIDIFLSQMPSLAKTPAEAAQEVLIVDEMKRQLHR
jgi:ABC-type hemin transport system substrate-binding protein